MLLARCRGQNRAWESASPGPGHLASVWPSVGSEAKPDCSELPIFSSQLPCGAVCDSNQTKFIHTQGRIWRLFCVPQMAIDILCDPHLGV